MNDAELEKLLKAAPVPERAPEFWEQLSRRISTKLHWHQRQSDNVNLPSRPRAGIIWGWGFAGAAVLVLVGFLAGNWHSNRQTMALLQNEKLLREVLATFPNQVRAIIQDENGLHLTLAEQADVPQVQPLWLRICEGGHCRTVMTFSGQTVQVGGKQIEALAEADGGVMLVGEHFFWSSREGGAGGAIQINAQQLHRTL
jgi:hypothetical protein